METLELDWLGSPRVRLNGAPLRLETRKVTALLAVLSLEPKPQSREFLTTLLWPEYDARRAPANLRRALSSLQASLGAGWVLADREAIALSDSRTLRVDFEELLASVREARAHHPEPGERLCAACIDALQALVESGRGDFLEGFNLKDCPDFDRWQTGKREELSRELGWTLELLAEAEGEAGRWEEAIALARRWLSLDELHEGAQRTLMFLYARSGKRNAALRQYDECARLLREELSMEPEEATRALAERIRRREPENRTATRSVPEARSSSQVPAAASPPVSPEGAAPNAARATSAPPLRLKPPPLRANRVPRQRLLALLDSGRLKPLTLVSAPAGFGKTTLLTDWVASRGLKAAWLSLEGGDNDAVRLFSDLAAALGVLDPDLGADARQMLHAIQVPALAVIVESLLADLARPGGPRILILDDCHLVTRVETQRWLADLAARLPPECHLVLATRMDPAFPLARMRAQDRIVEVRADDLRFLGDEALAFLRGVMALDLGLEDVALLRERTEGWAAGLQMAALSLRNRADASDFIRRFGGSNRHVADYLVGEVMEGQSPERQDFLLKTSILERFRAELCDELLGRRGSQDLLEELDKANLFLVPLDEERTWYRYHHLFAELLRHRLGHTSGKAEIEHLHRRAALWLDGHGDPEEAMHHYLAGEKYAEALDLLDRCHETLMGKGGMGMLLDWVARIPTPEIDSNAAACVTLGTLHAWAGKGEAAEGRFAQAELLLGAANSAIPEELALRLHGRVSVMRALIADTSGDSAHAIDLALEGGKLLEGDPHYYPRTLSPYILGKAYRYKGELEKSEAFIGGLHRAAWAARSAFSLSATLHELIWLHRFRGSLREADRLLDEFDTLPREGGTAGVVAKVVADRGELQRERGELGRAALTIATANADANRGGLPSDQYFCALSACRLALSLGDPDQAEREVRRGEEIARGALVWVSMFPLFEAERARVFLASGRIDEALAWAASYPLPEAGNVMNREAILMAKARVLIAAGREAEAAAILDDLARAAHRGKRFGRLVEILALRALAGRGEAEAEALLRSLSLAEAEGYARVFLDEGERMRRTLGVVLERRPEPPPAIAAYAQSLLSLP